MLEIQLHPPLQEEKEEKAQCWACSTPTWELNDSQRWFIRFYKQVTAARICGRHIYSLWVLANFYLQGAPFWKGYPFVEDESSKAVDAQRGCSNDILRKINWETWSL